MPNNVFRKPLFWSALATIALAVLLLLTASGREVLDTKFYYSPQDALAFFMTRDGTERILLERFAFIDLFLFIPAYGSFLVLLGRHMHSEKLHKLCLVLVTVALTADFIETALIWAGLREIGWESGRLTALLSVATPIKWTALSAWILVFLGDLRRR